MIWSDVKTKTLITLCSETEYVGKWMSDIPDEVEKSCWDSCMEFLSCTGGCCCRRQKESGYHQLPQSDSDEEVETERSAKTRFTDHSKSTADLESAESARTDEEAGMHAIDPRTSRITFDSIFEKTLLALGCQNSVLRTGNHEQLMTRIMLNSTQEYLDMASIYAGAIHRLGYLLEKPNLPNKDDLIARTEQARLELEHLVRIVSPFAKNVVPIMRELDSASEVVRFQIEEIDDNISQFLPKCEALIQQCQSLAQQYDRKANDKMNSILNLLTFITFIIIPMQLLTGLYGMNFRIMPELEWKHGYVFFWSLSISLSLLFAIILYRITSE
jgi:Mg2+ and Co2+ transporter CorA